MGPKPSTSGCTTEGSSDSGWSLGGRTATPKPHSCWKTTSACPSTTTDGAKRQFQSEFRVFLAISEQLLVRLEEHKESAKPQHDCRSLTCNMHLRPSLSPSLPFSLPRSLAPSLPACVHPGTCGTLRTLTRRSMGFHSSASTWCVQPHSCVLLSYA